MGSKRISTCAHLLDLVLAEELLNEPPYFLSPDLAVRPFMSTNEPSGPTHNEQVTLSFREWKSPTLAHCEEGFVKCDT